MLEVDKIRQLIEMMVANDLIEVSLRDGDQEVNLRRPNGLAGLPPVSPSLAVPQSAHNPLPGQAVSVGSDASPAPKEEEVAYQEISSPMVGTFYSASDPESGPFVTVGSEVHVGTVVCILEAMKVFNEIKSDIAGRIERILVKNSDAVEFGQTLFEVRPL